MNALLLLVPLSVALAYMDATPIAVFATAAAAIIPLASWIRRATEQIANRAGSSIGGLLNVTFGNAAEYFAAVYFARRDRMDLVMTICVGSSIQIALVTAPVLVLVSYAIGRPMNLVFTNPLELMAIAGSAFAVNSIALDGETTWFEGVMLIAVYILLAMAFLFATPR